MDGSGRVGASITSIITRWELGENQSTVGVENEACTRPTPRPSGSHTRHRSAFTTTRSHNRWWHCEVSTQHLRVKTFFWASPGRALREAHGACVGVSVVSYVCWACGPWRLQDRAWRRSWGPPHRTILTRTWAGVKEKARLLAADAPGAFGGPSPTPRVF